MADKKKKGINEFVHDVVHGSDHYKEYQAKMADFKNGVEKRKAAAAKAPVDAPSLGVFTITDTLIDSITINIDSDEDSDVISKMVQDTLAKVMMEVQQISVNISENIQSTDEIPPLLKRPKEGEDFKSNTTLAKMIAIYQQQYANKSKKQLGQINSEIPKTLKRPEEIPHSILEDMILGNFNNREDQEKGNTIGPNFDTAFAYTAVFEGGYANHPMDKGGETNRGIIMNNFKKWAKSDLGIEPTSDNLKKLTAEQAKILYKKHYWDRQNLDTLKDGNAAFAIFDFSVNSGGGIKALKKVLNASLGGFTINSNFTASEMTALNNMDGRKLFDIIQETRRNYIHNIVQRSVDSYLKKHPDASHKELLKNTQLQFEDSWIKRVNKIKYETH